MEKEIISKIKSINNEERTFPSDSISRKKKKTDPNIEIEPDNKIFVEEPDIFSFFKNKNPIEKYVRTNFRLICALISLSK